MKAMRLTGLNRMEMQEVPMPRVEKPGDVLLKLARVGVCGSDVHYYETGRIGSQVASYPFTVGHECAAIVEEVGGAVRRFKVGDAVAVDPAMPCHECDQCRIGREHTCRKLRFLGCPGQAEGCLSEYIVMPEHSLFSAEAITLDQAALCEPLSIGYYAVQQSGLAGGERVGILGAGPIGLSVLACARAKGCARHYVTDKLPERLAAAKQAGASWAGDPDNAGLVEDILVAEPGGLDVVYECCGQQEALDQALMLLKPGGKLMLIGIPRESRVSFSIDLLRRQEISVINVRRQNMCVQPTIDMVANKEAEVDFMLTHRFAFEQTPEAFELVKDYRDGVVKAMIDF